MASNEALQAMWKPKKTLRDWGKTEYKIVRNWTPREVKSPLIDHAHQTPTSSDNDDIDDHSPTSLSSFHGNISRQRTSKQVYDTDTLSGLESNGNHSDDDDDGRSERLGDLQSESISQATHISDSTLDETHSVLNKRQSTRRSVTHHSRLKHVSTDKDHSSIVEQSSYKPSESLQSRRVLRARQNDTLSSRSKSRNQKLSNRTTTQTVSTSVESETGLEDVGSGGEENVHVRLPTTLSDEEGSQVSSQNEGIHDNEDGVEESMEESEGESQQVSDVDIPIQKIPHKGKPKTKGLPKSRGTSLKMKLWHPKGIRRSKRNVNALDVCLTVYERVLSNKLDECDREEVQRALMLHWKYTQKHILSTVRSVHNTLLLEKLQRKEKLKQNQLQREMTSTLTSLRKAHGRYQKALSKARQAKKDEEEQAVCEDMVTVSDSLRSVFANYQ